MSDLIEMLQNFKSPIMEIPDDDNSIYVMREDLIPFSFGGNKVRIALEFLTDMKRHGGNCLVGYGGLKSNLNRALSNISIRDGIPYHIISSLDGRKEEETFNSRMAHSFESCFHYCRKDEVKKTVENVLSSLREQGLKPYYIYGDSSGEGNEHIPLPAYEIVYEKIRDEYDYVFVAVGTGTTLAGLLAGKAIFKGREKIIGISVARPAEQETGIIRKSLLCYSERIKEIDIPEIIVDDSCLAGGYGLYDAKIENIICKQMRANGLPLDPVYTGKAFCGMSEYLKKNAVTGKKVLFIHTGGTPLYFDYCLEQNTKSGLSG